MSAPAPTEAHGGADWAQRGPPSRFPLVFNFPDYTDEELTTLLEAQLEAGEHTTPAQALPAQPSSCSTCITRCLASVASDLKTVAPLHLQASRASSCRTPSTAALPPGAWAGSAAPLALAMRVQCATCLSRPSSASPSACCGRGLQVKGEEGGGVVPAWWPNMSRAHDLPWSRRHPVPSHC